MNIAEYQKWTRTVWNTEPDIEMQIINALLGLCGETGEVAEVIKKRKFHHKYDYKLPTFIEDLTKELGDVIYYLCRLADLHCVDIDQVIYFNVKKLQERHKDGFSPKYSSNPQKVIDLITDEESKGPLQGN